MELMVVLWFGSAVLCWVVANNKARFAGFWFLLGLLLGPLTLLVICLMPSRERVVGPTPSTHVKCPDCREFVCKEARVCKHCRCRLVPQS